MEGAAHLRKLVRCASSHLRHPQRSKLLLELLKLQTMNQCQKRLRSSMLNEQRAMTTLTEELSSALLFERSSWALI